MVVHVLRFVDRSHFQMMSEAPSGSVRVAVNAVSTCGYSDDRVRLPASSRLLMVMVRSCVAVRSPSEATTVTVWLSAAS